jgi:hypothetical protein
MLRRVTSRAITGYTHHTLRDARSAGSGIFCRFGLMSDDVIGELSDPA